MELPLANFFMQSLELLVLSVLTLFFALVLFYLCSFLLGVHDSHVNVNLGDKVFPQHNAEWGHRGVGVRSLPVQFRILAEAHAQ